MDDQIRHGHLTQRHAHRLTDRRRGRSMNEVLRILTSGQAPDAEFGNDLEAVCDAMRPLPTNPWARRSIELRWVCWRGQDL